MEVCVDEHRRARRRLRCEVRASSPGDEGDERGERKRDGKKRLKKREDGGVGERNLSKVEIAWEFCQRKGELKTFYV